MPCRRALEIDLEVLFREPDSPECRALVVHAEDCEDCATAISRRHEPRPEPTPRQPVVAVTGAAVVVVAVIALLALPDRTQSPPEPAPSEPARTAPHATPVPAGEAPLPTELLEALHLGLGESREIAAAAVSSGRPLLLMLQVPAVTDGVAALPVRIYAEDGRRLEGMGTIANGERERASFSVEADWLSRPGRYIVEVETTEKSHMPLRRFAIEVR